ncbi:MAG: hypothetical protein LBG65_04465 [Puniceicoccales bacterium]|jgi:DNA polymerase-3 subunit delta|nr:hypothetical protein [Puniceicoccales bacterium]
MPADSVPHYHYFTGDDEFLVNQGAQDCFDELSKGAEGDLAREVIDATCGNVEDAEAALESFTQSVRTVPMFGGKRYVWLRGLNWLADSVLGRSEGGQECARRLNEVLANHVDPAVTVVVISAIPVNGVRREAKELAKNGKTTVTKVAAKNPFKKEPLNETIASALEAEATRLNVRIRATVLDDLYERTGRNTRLAVEEIRKIACYLGPEGGEITTPILQRLVPVSGDGDFFEPVDAFYSGNLEWALESIQRFFFFNKPAACRGLLVNLQRRNRQIFQLKALAEAGALGPNPRSLNAEALARAAEKYGRAFGGGPGEKSELNIFTQHPFALSKLLPATTRFTLRALSEIQLAYVEIFSSLMDPAYRDDPAPLFRDLFTRTLAPLKR